MPTCLGLILLALLWVAYQAWSQPIPISWSSAPAAVVHVSCDWGYHRYALYPQDSNQCRVAFRGRGCVGTYGQTNHLPYSEAREFYWELHRRFTGRAWTTGRNTSARVIVASQEWRGELTQADADWLHHTWCAREANRWDFKPSHGPIPLIWIPAREAAPGPLD